MTNLTTRLDPTESKWINFWIEQNNKNADSFLLIMFLSSAPFLGVIILIIIVFGILCCISKLLGLYKDKKRAKNAQVLENLFEPNQLENKFKNDQKIPNQIQTCSVIKSNDKKDRKMFESKLDNFENIGFKNESINFKNKNLITDHKIKIVVENFDGRNEDSS